MSENGRLSAKQEALLLALVSGQKLEAAAKAVNVSARTAYRWQRLDSFQKELKQAKDKNFEHHLGILKEGIVTVLSTLHRNMSPDTPPAVQVSAARCWLETAIMLHKAEQVETAMEAMQEQMQAQMAELKAMEGGIYAQL